MIKKTLAVVAILGFITVLGGVATYYVHGVAGAVLAFFIGISFSPAISNVIHD